MDVVLLLGSVKVVVKGLGGIIIGWFYVFGIYYVVDDVVVYIKGCIDCFVDLYVIMWNEW